MFVCDHSTIIDICAHEFWYTLFIKPHFLFIIRVFYPKAGISLQTLEPRMKFCLKLYLPQKTQGLRLQFYWR